MLLQTTMKHGGTLIPGFLPQLEGLLVVAVEGFERRLQLRGQVQRIEDFRFAAALLRHLLADVLPQIAEHGISSPGMLSATGTRGSLTMPHSMASMSEKSLIVQGKSVPSA